MSASYPTLLFVPDGWADWPQPELDDRTPLQAARTPNLDRLAEAGRTYRAANIPEESPADSGIANMGLLGYDPRVHYPGRGPMEALNLGVELKPGESAFRCNLVTVEEGILTDYSAGNLETEVSTAVFQHLNRVFQDQPVRFEPGIRYRGVLVLETGDTPDCYPPHDEMGRAVPELWPEGPGGGLLTDLMRRSQLVIREFLADRYPEYVDRVSMIWPWGGGVVRDLPSVGERYNRSGHVVAGVDLINGLGLALGMKRHDVPGATGDFDTDMTGKVEEALIHLTGTDLVYLHVEAPDEAGHEGDADHKVEVIEQLDEEMLGPIAGSVLDENLELLVSPDHYTPIQKRTHVPDPVPLLHLAPDVEPDGLGYDEDVAEEAPLVEEAWDVLADLYAGNRRQLATPVPSETTSS